MWIRPHLFLFLLSIFATYLRKSSMTTPIIDREIFFGNPEISGGQISPDGQFISFIKPLNGVRNIWIKKRDDDFESAIPITEDETRPIGGYFWSRDAQYVLYVQDKDGDENYHVYAVNPAEAIATNTIPEARDLTPMDEVRAFIYRLPKSNHNQIYVGINDRDKAWHDLYTVDIDSGDRKLVLENTINYSSLYFDLKDELRLASRSTADGGTELLKLAGESWDSIMGCTHEETLSPYRFHKDGRVYLISNVGDDIDLSTLYLLDLQTLTKEKIASDPEEEVDYGGMIYSDLREEMIGSSYTGDKKRLYWLDKDYEADYHFLQGKFDGAEVSFGSGTTDEQTYIVYASSDTDPGAAYLFDRDGRHVEFLYRPRPELPIEHLSKMQPVRYPSIDGLEIPAYLTLPKDYEGGKIPAIMFVHGGPWARDHWGYNSYAQFLSNRGYAVLQPNFRGSTGFGKKFLNAGNGAWGEAMQDDITAGTHYLINQGISDADQIGIMGGSYGGYATLAGLTFTPDTYACGVSIVGPSNLFTLLQSIPPYWESVREMFHIRLGHPDTPEGQEQLKRKSPFFHAKNIKVPLLVAQGDNDPRVKTAESDQIVVAMRDLGLPVEYVNFPDEGHGFANPDNSMAFLTVCEAFLAKHLGGRYQEDVPDRLKEIIDKVTVDIEALELG